MLVRSNRGRKWEKKKKKEKQHKSVTKKENQKVGKKWNEKKIVIVIDRVEAKEEKPNILRKKSSKGVRRIARKEASSSLEVISSGVVPTIHLRVIARVEPAINNNSVRKIPPPLTWQQLCEPQITNQRNKKKPREIPKNSTPANFPPCTHRKHPYKRKAKKKRQSRENFIVRSLPPTKRVCVCVHVFFLVCLCVRVKPSWC